jgi:hypothetical protein
MTRLPQLEQELVAAAARLGSPRRMVAPAARAALAIAVVVVVVVVAGVVAVVDGDGGRPQATGAPPFPPDANLEDMLGVFRQPATPADDMGFTKDDFNQIPDRQPGEDPTRARRVEWPGASISLWPMRDGVCHGVGGGGGCVGLDHLRRMGVSVGLHSSSRQQSVYGVVVDGIEEVVLTASGGPDLPVPVRENFFFVDLEAAAAKLGTPGWVERVQTVRWRYGGEERGSNVGRFLQRVVAPPAPPGMSDGAPVPNVDPLAESTSDPLSFTVAGARYTAIGFQTSRSHVCTSLEEVDAGVPHGQSCLSERLLRNALERQPAHLFAGGGGVRNGFARADVVDIAATDATVVLSEPWRPEPWEGEPIRFFFVFDPDEPAPGERLPEVPLAVRLSDGQTVQVP